MTATTTTRGSGRGGGGVISHSGDAVDAFVLCDRSREDEARRALVGVLLMHLRREKGGLTDGSTRDASRSSTGPAC